ncbi:MAG: hypothetical protein OXF26_05750 [Alphaproteobacteria bacterium]|nr:hypothetical protein [Alphaproteobacteria bacterium]MCY4319612.1 hypothetical protein [Alphaproteobacteria bacterium]
MLAHSFRRLVEGKTQLPVFASGVVDAVVSRHGRMPPTQVAELTLTRPPFNGVFSVGNAP